jgi:hypothetical protein
VLSHWRRKRPRLSVPDVCQTRMHDGCVPEARSVGSQKNTPAVCRSRRCSVVGEEYWSRLTDGSKGATRTTAGLTRARRVEQLKGAPTHRSESASTRLLGVRRITSITSVRRPTII